MDQRAHREPNRDDDQDIHKGAIEDLESPGNPNAPALDENGWPNDPVAIAQDVIGANEDETQG